VRTQCLKCICKGDRSQTERGGQVRGYGGPEGSGHESLLYIDQAWWLMLDWNDTYSRDQ
jgi:hypothetical protein